jgi:DNA-binding HxlR family transcriptional regulator
MSSSTRTPDTFSRFRGSSQLLAILADKWTIPVMHSLARGTRRFGELHRELTGVSQKVLTQCLRSLERHGLVERTVFPVIPPKVEYALTPLGESLNEPLAALCRWVEKNGKTLERRAEASQES